LITGDSMLDGLLAFALIVIAVVWFVVAYNNLDAAAQRTALAWGNVDALLKQRHDELPRFVEACRPHVPGEQALLQRIQQANTAVFAARQDTANLGRAENELRTTLGRLVAIVEGRPDLMGDEGLAALRKRVTALETGLAERRAIFNDAAQQNNAAVGRFPGNVVALLGGFRSVPPFEVDAGQR
jgi:LemA protein